MTVICDDISNRSNVMMNSDTFEKLPLLEFFTVHTKIAIQCIGIKGFNNSKKELPPAGLDLMQEIITGLGVQCLTNLI